MAKKPNDSTKKAPVQDAVDLLTADHKRVAKLFAEFSNLKDSGSASAKSMIVAMICQELVIHTAIEEGIFYPAVRIAIDDEDQMDEALVEHAGAKDLIAQLQSADPKEDLYDAKVTVLGEQIDHHVEEEEGSMFPQAKASKLDLIALGADLLARKEALRADPTAASSPAKAVPALGAGDDGEEDDEEIPVRDRSASSKRKSAPAKSASRLAKPKTKTSTKKR